MLTIDQFHEFKNTRLDSDYYSLVPNVCNYCKRPIIINEERTIMKCSNKYCPEHMSYKADTMFKDMGIKYIGARTSYGIITKNKLKSHMDILSLDIKDLPNSHAQDVKERMWNSLQKGRKQSLAKILKMYQLDGISDQTSNKVVEGYSSFEEFFNEHQDVTSVVKHMVKSLGQNEITHHLLRMSYHLHKSKEDLLRVEKYFEVVKLNDEKIRVCMTGEISSAYVIGKPFKPREAFLEYLNSKYENTVSFISTGRNVSDSHFLLTDSSRRTGKFDDANRLNVPILKFSQFCDYIEMKYGKGKEDHEILRRI